MSDAFFLVKSRRQGVLFAVSTPPDTEKLSGVWKNLLIQLGKQIFHTFRMLLPVGIRALGTLKSMSVAKLGVHLGKHGIFLQCRLLKTSRNKHRTLKMLLNLMNIYSPSLSTTKASARLLNGLLRRLTAVWKRILSYYNFTWLLAYLFSLSVFPFFSFVPCHSWSLMFTSPFPFLPLLFLSQLTCRFSFTFVLGQLCVFYDWATLTQWDCCLCWLKALSGECGLFAVFARLTVSSTCWHCTMAIVTSEL